jgi:hypothetical protein
MRKLIKSRWAAALVIAFGLAVVFWIVGTVTSHSGNIDEPLIRISEQTTYLTEPLDAEGYVDYLEAINHRWSEGVTPENNFEVVVRRVMGVKGIDETVRAEYLRRLGMGDLPKDHRHFQSFLSIIDARFGENGSHSNDPQKVKELRHSYGDAFEKPWSTRDSPLIAEWLHENSELLDIVVEGSKRSKSFTPCLVRTGKDATGILLDFVSVKDEYRVLGSALYVRAMHRLGAGNVSGAWNDLQAVHRIARHTANAAISVERLIGSATEAMACRGDLAFLRFGRLDSRQIRDYEADLRKLTPIPTLVPSTDWFNRFVFLDVVASASRGDAAKKGMLGKQWAGKLADQDSVSSIDWNAILEWGNDRYDRLVLVAKTDNHAERHRIMDAIMEESKQSLKNRKQEATIVGRLLSGKSQKTLLTEGIRDTIFALIMPAVSIMTDGMRRGDFRRLATRVAFALMAFRLDHGTFPDQLEKLVPEYIDHVPVDPFSGAPIVYRKRPDGVVIHSAGPNQDDESNIHTFAAPTGPDFSDDITIYLPQELK